LDHARASCPASTSFGRRDTAIDLRAHPAWIDVKAVSGGSRMGQHRQAPDNDDSGALENMIALCAVGFSFASLGDRTTAKYEAVATWIGARISRSRSERDSANKVDYGSIGLSGVPGRDLLNEVGRRIRRRVGMVLGRSSSS
jgi:hypothetical protein